MPPGLDRGRRMVTNSASKNPYSLSPLRDSKSFQNLRSTRSPSSGPENAPIPVDMEPGIFNATVWRDAAKEVVSPEFLREAPKEVTGSWQTDSRGNNLPIPVIQHSSANLHNELVNDAKGGQPPSYDALARPRSVGNTDNSLAMATFLEPEGSSRPPSTRPEDRSAVGQLLSWIPPVPSPDSRKRSSLMQPIIIPQLQVPPSGERVPFSRCYSDVLTPYGVSQREFLAFLDGFSLAQAPNAYLQGLRMFGLGIALIPFPGLPITGKGIMALGSSGSGDSGSRARLYLERARAEYFAPRGLRISVVSDDDLNRRIGIPTHTSRLAPLTRNTVTESLCKRRFEGLSPYVAPLRFDVPEPDKQIQGVQKMARKHLDSRLKRDRKDIDKLREQQWVPISVGDSPDFALRYVEKMAVIRRLQDDLTELFNSSHVNEEIGAAAKREMVDELQDQQKQLRMLVAERHQVMAADPSSLSAETEEETRSRKLRWLVIEDS